MVALIVPFIMYSSLSGYVDYVSTIYIDNAFLEATLHAFLILSYFPVVMGIPYAIFRILIRICYYTKLKINYLRAQKSEKPFISVIRSFRGKSYTSIKPKFSDPEEVTRTDRMRELPYNSSFEYIFLGGKHEFPLFSRMIYLKTEDQNWFTVSKRMILMSKLIVMVPDDTPGIKLEEQFINDDEQLKEKTITWHPLKSNKGKINMLLENYISKTEHKNSHTTKSLFEFIDSYVVNEIPSNKWLNEDPPYFDEEYIVSLYSLVFWAGVLVLWLFVKLSIIH